MLYAMGLKFNCNDGTIWYNDMNFRVGKKSWPNPWAERVSVLFLSTLNDEPALFGSIERMQSTGSIEITHKKKLPIRPIQDFKPAGNDNYR